MGENISYLSVKELNQLEVLLEKGINRIRLRQVRRNFIDILILLFFIKYFLKIN